VIPKPASQHPLDGSLPLSEKTPVTFQGAAGSKAAEGFARWLRRWMGWRLPTEEAADPKPNGVHFSPEGAEGSLGEEGYELLVAPTGAVVRALGEAGLFYGGQTLACLVRDALGAQAGPLSIPAMVVRDEPRFAWRESMLDCCRHMPSVAYIERHLDLMALLKLNRFHWHLTEDQGWRIQIDGYPRLMEVAAWRKAEDGSTYGGFYTKDEVRHIVRYAKERCIEVVPEIEMPGHSMAALAAYPELGCTGGPYEVGTKWGIYEDIYCAGNDAVFEFLQGVLEEVLELFPFGWVHIGGDEAPKARWQSCPKCKARIRAEGLEDEFELQSWFIRRMEAWLAERGRRLIGWDEIHEGGLPPSATVQWWRGWMKEVALEAARHGHDIVSTPTSHCYLDYGYDEYPVEHTYGFDPIPEELDAAAAAKVLGGGGNMWTEHTPTEADMDRQIWPRKAAIAECLWTPKQCKSWPDFERRLKAFEALLRELGVRYGPWA